MAASSCGVDSTHSPQVLAPLLVIGAGLGLTFAPAMSTATLGVARGDAGVASAMVNTMQQVGGSLGIALLSTLAASAATSYMHGKLPTADVISHATVHGYTVAFWIAAGVFALGAVVCTVLFPKGVVEATRTPNRTSRTWGRSAAHQRHGRPEPGRERRHARRSAAALWRTSRGLRPHPRL